MDVASPPTTSYGLQASSRSRLSNEKWFGLATKFFHAVGALRPGAHPGRYLPTAPGHATLP